MTFGLWHLLPIFLQTQAREALGVVGLLPSGTSTLENEVARALQAVRGSGGGLAAYQQLAVLRATNEAVFFALLQAYPAEMLPLVYTPVVGDACLNWGKLMLRPQVRGSREAAPSSEAHLMPPAKICGGCNEDDDDDDRDDDDDYYYDDYDGDGDDDDDDDDDNDEKDEEEHDYGGDDIATEE